MRLRHVLSGAAVALLAVAGGSSPAAAEDLHGLGSKTQLVLTVDRLFPFFSYSRTSITSVANGSTRTIADSGASFGFLFGTEPALGTVHTIPRLAFDAVIIKGFTLGGSFAIALGLSHKQTDESVNNASGAKTSVTTNEPRSSIIGFAPRFGYIFGFTEAFGFWPRLGFGVYSRNTKRDIIQGANVVGTNTVTDTVLSLDIDPQLVVAPTQHFFFHFGPIFNIPLTGSSTDENAIGQNSSSTSRDLSVFHFGISIGLGAWF